MKHALLLLIGLASACSITHRSSDYACTKAADCTGGRVCSDGFCVVPNGSEPDAPPAHADARTDAPVTHPDGSTSNGCPVGCSSCNQGTKTCNIECGAANAADCTHEVTCPSGWACNVDCKTNQSCRAGISCTDATACTITCSGSGACKNVECGDGPCDVKCTGASSCSSTIECNDSCKCDIECTNTSQQTCAQNIDCGNACTDQVFGGCTSTPGNICATTCP